MWLHHAGQRLGVVPSLGAAVAAWQMECNAALVDVWRPWDGVNLDMYRMASFAMMPWCNRISGGGFEHGGVFYPVAPNREGERYPIHGDGWLQAWSVTQPSRDTLAMRLESHCFGGNPYAYEAIQTFRLVEGGLDQTVSVRHLGDAPLPYGVGLHPWLARDEQTWVRADVQGVWLNGANPLPDRHTNDLPATWTLQDGVSARGTLINNVFSGWEGKASIGWPERGLQLDVLMEGVYAPAGKQPAYCLLYRPPAGEVFCFEPVSHLTDAFHQSGLPGLLVLRTGERLSMFAQWRVHGLA